MAWHSRAIVFGRTLVMSVFSTAERPLPLEETCLLLDPDMTCGGMEFFGVLLITTILLTNLFNLSWMFE